jgi:hypothetical protein
VIRAATPARNGHHLGVGGPCPVTCTGGGQVCHLDACCTPFCPTCRRANVSNGCGGTCLKNCTGNCCEDFQTGELVCQTNPCM